MTDENTKSYFDGVMDTIHHLRQDISKENTSDIDIGWILKRINQYEEYHKEKLVGL